MENAAMQQGYDPRSAAANGGFGRPQASPVGVSTPLDDLAKSLDTAANRIATLNQRARQIADTLIGGEPESKTGGTNQPPRMGRMGSLYDQAELLHAGLGELERQISRIGSVG